MSNLICETVLVIGAGFSVCLLFAVSRNAKQYFLLYLSGRFVSMATAVMLTQKLEIRQFSFSL